MVNFGQRLKSLRLRSGMTQKELADKLGLTKSVISYYELQERSPSPEILVKLSTIFRVSTDYLLGLDPYPSTDLDLSQLTNEDIQLLCQIIDALRAKNIAQKTST